MDKKKSIPCILTSLQQFRLRVDNLDKLVKIYKYWPRDTLTNCELIDISKLAKFFFVVKETLLEENDDLFEKIGYFEKIRS
jgi:hypothetical protein